MNPFIRFLYEKPFFAVCFVFYSIPFWVPLLGLLAGADPVLMLSTAALCVMTKAYIDSEISFRDPLGLMLKYFLASPLIFLLKLILIISVVVLLALYGLKGEPLDKAIAALLMVYAVIKLYFSRKKGGWNIPGLGSYRFYSFAGKALAAFLWLSFFLLDMGFADSIAVASCALAVSGFTFYKLNEGLL